MKLNELQVREREYHRFVESINDYGVRFWFYRGYLLGDVYHVTGDTWNLSNKPLNGWYFSPDIDQRGLSRQRFDTKQEVVEYLTEALDYTNLMQGNQVFAQERRAIYERTGMMPLHPGSMQSFRSESLDPNPIRYPFDSRFNGVAAS